MIASAIRKTTAPLRPIAFVLGVTALCFLTTNATAAPAEAHVGLQLYSLRLQAKKDMPATLDQAKAFGFKAIESAGTGSLSPAEFAVDARRRGLVPVSEHAFYVNLKKDIAGAVRDAKAMGVKYIMTSVPKPRLAEIKDGKGAQEIVAEFKAWGAAFRAEGISFGYHTHGGEFMPLTPEGDTLLSILMRDTPPELLCFQMDVFWVVSAGQDPVKVLQANPDRWKLMHIKDLRKGIGTGLGVHVDGKANCVPIGQGQIDWKALFATAEKVGIEYYFVEEESPTPLENIPQSLAYLKTLRNGS